MNDQNKLCFVLNFKTKGIHFSNKRYEPIEINVAIPEVLPSTPSVQIKIKQKIDQHGGVAFDGSGEGSAKCEIAASEEQCKFVDALNNHQYKPYFKGIQLPLLQRGEEQISLEGNIRSGFAISGQLLPAELVDLSTGVKANLEGAVIRLINLLRWQQDVTSPANPIDFFGLYWRHLSKVAHHVPSIQEPMTLNTIDHIHWIEDNRLELQNLLSVDNMNEPLGHQLLREAKEFFVQHHLRTAALIAYVALETGTKQFIQYAAPASSWLIANIQSPPITKLLRGYIPQLVNPVLLAEKKWLNLKPLLNRLDKLMVCRNNIVHFGNVSDDKPIPDSYLSDVSDILYIFDVLNGHQWAKRHLSQETLTALEWSADRDEQRDGMRGLVIISEGFNLS